ncbi:hypothetical protein FisN_14Hh171 [Fistulifera solaris]|uniref:5-hmdU DNA kinase helical domain-containing protein n=1 Tax=Fistulifera solaris TaxID=1519565 RepID=A0A1Z5K8I0_FISSO|nr:hypothetical protein FisN_14Hh171 [Fistulifera solaris]|eukprot:GAX22547.1 hypothetical protein FisN_14Hh171 [Fistulifera solaris]
MKRSLRRAGLFLSLFFFSDAFVDHHRSQHVRKFFNSVTLLSGLNEENSERKPRRLRQKRRKPTVRRPDGYWSNLDHLQAELRTFWSDHGVALPLHQPPPIPNEVLLRYYQRHDLRAALVKWGGRDAVSQLWGGSPVIPGRWKEAVQASPELRQLVQADATLSMQSPPSLSRKNTKHEQESSLKWKHQEGRKPKGYWNTKTLLKELYTYVSFYRENHQRPAVWMPRPSEFAKEGRDDLRQAFHRFGGAEKVARLAGMVPFREWYYFEGQLELLMELQRYLNEYGKDETFPVVEDVKRHGFDQLYSLIQFYGGRKFLAARFGMKTVEKSDLYADLNFGPFSIDFAVRLLTFIRRREMRKNPPLIYPTIKIPSPIQLSAGDEEAIYLHESIIKFGGYENVARRLGLAFYSASGKMGNQGTG